MCLGLAEDIDWRIGHQEHFFGGALIPLERSQLKFWGVGVVSEKLFLSALWLSPPSLHHDHHRGFQGAHTTSFFSGVDETSFPCDVALDTGSDPLGGNRLLLSSYMGSFITFG